jgi:hypothetical protein
MVRDLSFVSRWLLRVFVVVALSSCMIMQVSAYDYAGFDKLLGDARSLVFDDVAETTSTTLPLSQAKPSGVDWSGSVRLVENSNQCLSDYLIGDGE